MSRLIRDSNSADYILRDPVKKGSKSKERMQAVGGGSGSRLTRIINRAPEVMVKITSTAATRAQSLGHLQYITRNGKLDAENDKGDTVSGSKDVVQLHKEWNFTGKQFAEGAKGARAQTIHVMLSMPPGTDRFAVGDAARAFASKTFGPNHQYVWAQHDDTGHPHVHIAVRAQGRDMKWVKRSKADLQDWRQTFAEELRARGVVAEASPRRARGIVQKADKSAMYRLKSRAANSTVIRSKVAEAAESVRTGQKVEGPWDKKIVERQSNIRKAYEDVLANMKNQPEQEASAKKLEAWIKSMPPIQTERDALRQQVGRLMQTRARDNDSMEL